MSIRTLKNAFHLVSAICANVYYGFPSRGMRVIGITGTDGKTTTTHMVYHILKNAGYPVSMISTIGATLNGIEYTTGFHVTTPSPWALQRFLALVRKQHNASMPSYVVIEVSSHALDQHRVWGIPFQWSGLTNITHEHLDYHKTYERYVHAKCILLAKAKETYVNADDMSYPYVMKELADAPCRVRTFGQHNADVLLTAYRSIDIMPTRYYAYNATLAAAICHAVGLTKKDINTGLSTFSFPKGRNTLVQKRPFRVMIDFAHTPNAFAMLLSELKQTTKGRLIHVFGSAGERDIIKRQHMGEISAAHADKIVLTAEDPRTEDVMSIIAMIRKGIPSGVDVQCIPDRRKAIGYAIAEAKAGDTIVITGKAHETTMNYGNGEVPWDEFAEVNKALKNRKK
jgi:UDP-N-acetylmuramoyl-L-alanyl-D-glutamate--2,6-diaminopimelate ligase